MQSSASTTSAGGAEGAAPHLALAAVDARSRDRVARWLADPAVAAFCGGRSTAEARIAIALATPSAVCRTIVLDGAPVGYAHALDAGLGDDAEGPVLAAGMAECFLFVGETAARGQGHWGKALDLLAAEVLSTTLALACAIVLPLRNERVVRAAERAGFRWRAVHLDPRAGPSWVMVRDRQRGGLRSSDRACLLHG